MEVLDKYNVFFENTKIPVVIYDSKTDINNTYEVGIIQVSKYTQVFLDKIKEDLEREGIFDENIKKEELDYITLKKIYLKKIDELMKYYFPDLRIEKKDKITTYLMQKSLDLGFVDILISDPQLEEITINGEELPIMVYHRKHGWLKTNLTFISDEEINAIASRIALDNRKNFSNLNPLLDAHLRGGHRVNAILDVIATKGSSITIRRFSDSPWTVSQLLSTKTASLDVLALIWIAIENEASIIIAGGTGSGKTSYLNAIAQFIPGRQRIISVEDTREIRLPDYTHWVPMEARQANQEGKGQVSILDLIVNSLRMRPDRIVIGEIRRKAEAEVLFEAMRTGHSVYGTFHANTARETILRLSSAPIEIPKLSLSSIGLLVIQHRDRISGKRYTLHIAEIDEDGNERIILQYLPKLEKYKMVNEPIYTMKKLEEFQGITKEQFQKDLTEKKMVLNFFVKNKIEEINAIGKLINLYYQDKKKMFENMRITIEKLKLKSKT
jgi:archaeal flagellar protein FlaI